MSTSVGEPSPNPLADDQVTYDDGTPQKVDQYAKDVSAFLMWAAEPHLEAVELHDGAVGAAARIGERQIQEDRAGWKRKIGILEGGVVHLGHPVGRQLQVQHGHALVVGSSANNMGSTDMVVWAVSL